MKTESVKDILAVMKPCFGKAQGFDSLVVVDGMAKAYDQTQAIGLPFPFPENFRVKALDFSKVVAAADPAKLKLEKTDDHIIVKSGRSRTKIPVLQDTELFIPEPEESGWLPFPDIISALKYARKFIAQEPESDSNRMIALTLFIANGFIYGTNAHIACRMKCPDTGESRITLPHWAADFIFKAPKISHWQFTQNFVAFKFESGGWYRSQLIDLNYPQDNLDFTLKPLQGESNLGPEISLDMTGEFATAFKEATAFGAKTVKLTAKGLVAIAGETECTVELPLPLTRETLWSVDYLESVLATGTGFFPEPVNDKNRGFFRGNGADGVIMGQL